MAHHPTSSLLTMLLLASATFGIICTAAEEEDGFRVKRSDDTPSAALQTLVQQQAATIQTLQARLTALETETAQLKARQQALSAPVAFSVRFKTEDGANGIPIVTHTTLKFDDIISNVGNGYDPQTGIFTAPVAGVYSFFLRTMSVNGHPMVQLSINKHGVTLDVVFAEGNQDNDDQGSTQITIHLEAGEQVWVQQEYGDAVRGYFWTIFTGYLVQAQP